MLKSFPIYFKISTEISLKTIFQMFYTVEIIFIQFFEMWRVTEIKTYNAPKKKLMLNFLISVW